MKNQLAANLESRIQQYTGRKKIEEEKVENKLALSAKRKAEIVKVIANGQVITRETLGDHDHLLYHVHLKYLINQNGKMYMEEEVEERKASFYKGGMYDDIELPVIYPKQTNENDRDDRIVDENFADTRAPYKYDRLQAVRYAERWWNEYNPAYVKFEVDCTNYISQCLHQGGAPMRGQSNRNKGWWHTYKNWSYSWSVANALKNYLQNSKTGLKAREVHDPLQLQLGDVICYDFQGDGRYRS